jgi:hypothetical protein
VVSEREVRIRANPTSGFRTFSRQTLTRPGSWTVALVGVDGRVLDERTFSVP